MAMVERPDEISKPKSIVRVLSSSLGDKWSELGLSVEAFLLLGKEFVKSISRLVQHNSGDHIHSRELQAAFSFLYRESVQFVMQPILMKQNLWSEASRFYDDVSEELGWSPQEQEKRLFEVHTEIFAKGAYTHTQPELEIGARLAWRNSAKCVGR